MKYYLMMSYPLGEGECIEPQSPKNPFAELMERPRINHLDHEAYL
jgi:hypothetical protein